VPRKESEPLKLIGVRAYASDVEWFQRFYAALSYGRVIRLLMRKHRNAVERKLSTKDKAPEAIEEEIDV